MRPISKTTVNSVATKATKTSQDSELSGKTIQSTTASQKSAITHSKSSHQSSATLPKPQSSTTSKSTKSTRANLKSAQSLFSSKSQSLTNNEEKKSVKKKVQKTNGDNALPSMNQNDVTEVLKINKNKIQVLEKNDIFDSLKSKDLQIQVNEDFIVLKGKTNQIMDETRYTIDKKSKQVVTRLDNVGNLKAKFLKKDDIVEYINFILLQERILCAWDVNEKVYDVLVYAMSQEQAVAGSKVIQTSIQSIEIDKEEFELESLQQFLKDNKKVWVVPRKKKGDIVLIMTNDQYVKYQRLFNPSPTQDNKEVQIIEMPLPLWKLQYFMKFSEVKFKSLCNLYKVHYRFLEDHLELHGNDLRVVAQEIERIANDVFISIEIAFSNAPKLTKSVAEKCEKLEMQKHTMISIDNKARPHSGWLGNQREAMMHIITMIGPVETCDCDILVCPVTPTLEAFGCVKDVFQKGGKQVSTDISKLLKNSEELGTPIEPEEIIVLQNTGNLKCQLLLLTVIPPWTRKRDVILSLLYNCARRVVNIVSNTGYRSIGLPLNIADDFPSSMYSSILVNNFWKLRQKFGHFVHIYGYADTVDSVEEFEDFLASEITIFGHWSKIMFDKKKTLLEKQTSSIAVDIVEDSMVNMDDKVDVIVNATNHKDLEYSKVSRQVIEKAGRDMIVPEYLKLYPDGIGVCDVAVTQPGNLQCRQIFHGCLFGWIMYGDLSVKMLKLFLTRCLEEAERRQLSSIAFPALGSSLLVFPPVLVAKVMFKTVERFGENENPQHLKKVDFVLSPMEKDVTEIFRNVQDWMISRRVQLSSFKVPPKHIQCIHKKHGTKFMVAMLDHYKDIKYKEVKVTMSFTNKEDQAEVSKPVWDMSTGSYNLSVKMMRAEKSLSEGLQKVVELIESHRFHIVDMVLLNSRESGVIKDSRPSSFGPWTEDETKPQKSAGMSLHKQIDLIMTTILKNTDKIYKDNNQSNRPSRLSYIRLVRMFATTYDFKDMLKKLKKDGYEGGHGETSSWHIYEKKPEIYKYHIQAVGRKEDTEAVLEFLKNDVLQMEEPKKASFKLLQPFKKVRIVINRLYKTGYKISLDEAGKKAVFEGTSKDVIDVRKELEEYIDNTLNINLSENDFVALMHLSKKDPWMKDMIHYVYEKGTLVLTYKKGLDPEPLLKSVKNKMEDIRKMSETEIVLQKKLTLILEDIEKEVNQTSPGVFCYLSYNKKKVLIKAQNIKKAQEGKAAVQVILGMTAAPRKKTLRGEVKSQTPAIVSGDKQNGTKFTTKEGINILVYQADFQKLKADCLVSPTTKNLKPSKGIGQEIVRIAGAQVEKACEAYIEQNGEVPVGTCCSTKAGTLPYHCLLHVSMPYWDSSGDGMKECLTAFRSAIVAALHEANSHKHKSVAFTSIGADPFSIPGPFCAIQYYKGVTEYGSHMKNEDNLIQDVHFIDTDENIVQTLNKTFSKYLGGGKPL